MQPAHPTGAVQGFGPPVGGPSVVRLSVLADGNTVARATLSRRITPRSVRIRQLTVRRDGVFGFLFTPAGHVRRPAVLAFGGSEGGYSSIDEAGLLAAHGYPALALAYFNAPGLPSQLVRIPLEYFARAGRILRAQPEADPARIVPLGVSYGGEASLLVAATFPRLFHGAIALVPSARVTSGLPRLGGDAAAWTLHGRAVPEGPIAVERISGPVLVQGAGSDGEWPSADAVAEVQHRLAAHRFRFPHEGVVYPRAGHYSGIAVPNLPEPTDQPSAGGSPSADAAARADLWNRIQRYLRRG
jgi:dienelactone hydrolase